MLTPQAWAVLEDLLRDKHLHADVRPPLSTPATCRCLIMSASDLQTLEDWKMWDVSKVGHRASANSYSV